MEYPQYSNSCFLPPLNYSANLQYETQDASHYQPPYALHWYDPAAQVAYYSVWQTNFEMREIPSHMMMMPPQDNAAFVMPHTATWPGVSGPGVEVQDPPSYATMTPEDNREVIMPQTMDLVYPYSPGVEVQESSSHTITPAEENVAFIMPQTINLDHHRSPSVEVQEPPAPPSNQVGNPAPNTPQAINSSLPEMTHGGNSSDAGAVQEPKSFRSAKKAKETPKRTAKTGKSAPRPAKKSGKKPGRGKRGSNLQNASPGDCYQCHWDGCKWTVDARNITRHLRTVHGTRLQRFGTAIKCQWFDLHSGQECDQMLQPSSVKAHIGGHLHKEGQHSPFVHQCEVCWKCFVKRGNGPCEHYENRRKQARRQTGRQVKPRRRGGEEF